MHGFLWLIWLQKWNGLRRLIFTGLPRDHIREGLRGFPYRNRCIYYRSYDDRIVIVRVIHGAQDIEKQEFE